MAPNYIDPSYASRLDKPQSLAAEGSATTSVVYPSLLRTLAHADRACCCSARPSVMAIMPAAPGRAHRTELLLCMHHYRAARKRLTEAKATVLDTRGRRLTDEDIWSVPLV
jgi:hypothetical protein